MTARRSILSLFGVACFVLAFGAAPLVDPSPGKKMKEILAKLPNASEQEGEQIASRLSAERAELQSQLILQLGSPKSKEHQIVVVYLLGLYRMDGATRALTKVITLEAERKELHKRLPLWGRYPAVDALAKIGMRSIPPVIERIETSEDKLVTELGSKVIKQILGRELAEATIKQAIDKQPNQDTKKKLEEALQFLKP